MRFPACFWAAWAENLFFRLGEYGLALIDGLHGAGFTLTLLVVCVWCNVPSDYLVTYIYNVFSSSTSCSIAAGLEFEPGVHPIRPTPPAAVR